MTHNNISDWLPVKECQKNVAAFSFIFLTHDIFRRSKYTIYVTPFALIIWFVDIGKFTNNPLDIDNYLYAKKY